MEHRKSKYAEKFKDPRWQKMRLLVLERDKWACQHCENKKHTLHVHHLYYEPKKEPWEYPLEAFITLCEECHEIETMTRENNEKLLLRTLREKAFSSGAVLDLARGFDSMPPTNVLFAEITAATIEWVLTKARILEELNHRHAEYRQKKRD